MIRLYGTPQQAKVLVIKEVKALDQKEIELYCSWWYIILEILFSFFVVLDIYNIGKSILELHCRNRIRKENGIILYSICVVKCMKYGVCNRFN